MTKKVRFISAIIIVLIGITISFIFFSQKDVMAEEDVAVVDSSEIVPPVFREFGIAVDSFDIMDGSVKRNEYLAEILQSYNVPNSAIEKIVRYGKDIFDFRKVRAGNRYKLYAEKDTLHTVKYFVYEHSPVEYYIMNFEDSAYVEKWEKQVDTIPSVAEGVIVSSLWNAMVDNKINPLMANELSEVYAWVIDFFGLQVGDSFKVVYKEFYVDTISLGIQKIESAYFKHMGADFYAIPFVQDSTLSFFDSEGNSLRRAFLKAPLKYSRISSGFSNSRLHPILKIYRPHHGVDYCAPLGTPVHAIGDGVVIKKGFIGGAGNMVKIKHNSVYTTTYMHLSKYGAGVSVGSYVKQGDVIGYVGSTGLSTGPHLDFRVYKNGQAINPLKLEAPPVEPIKEENRVAFDSVRTIIMQRLKNI